MDILASDLILGPGDQQVPTPSAFKVQDVIQRLLEVEQDEGPSQTEMRTRRKGMIRIVILAFWAILIR